MASVREPDSALSQPSAFDENSAKKRGGVSEWLRTHFVSRRTPQDEGILQTTSTLIDQLGLSTNKPRAVWWNNTISTSKYSTKDIPSDFPLLQREVLVIAERMIGKLSPEEWEPLIASSLLYYRSPIASERSRRIWGRVVLPLFLMAFLVEVATYFYSFFWSVILALPLLLVLMVVGNALSDPKSRDSWLEADSKAAELVGRERLLNTLAKVDGLGMKDVERSKRGRRFSDRPSITRRIENLQSYASLP